MLSEQSTYTALELPLPSILPSISDFDQLKERMVIIVERIISAYVPAFNSVSVTKHIPHVYSENMSMKNEIVS